MARSEFRFVVDGVELTAEQQSAIAAEIQKAGLNALSKVGSKLDSPLTVGHANLKLRPEWYGLWVLNGDIAKEVGQRINELGFWMPK